MNRNNPRSTTLKHAPINFGSELVPAPKKSYGQHFLKNPMIIEKIVQDFKGMYSTIVEVGPGPGTLTESLVKINKPFIVFEKDERFQAILNNLVGEKNVFIVDALEHDINQTLTECQFDENIWLVSNLPYNVGTPLLIKFLTIKKIAFMTLMFQKEVADKISPAKNEKNSMSSLYAIVNSFFQVEDLVQVPPSAFFPPPKVQSKVIRLTRLEKSLIPMEEFDLFESFNRFIFRSKRKQLCVVMKERYTKEKIASEFNNLGIDQKIRAEALTLTEVIKLYETFSKRR